MNQPTTTLNVLRIVRGTSVDGPGLRTSVYLAGCTHHCPGCHNPQSWDFGGGTTMTVDEIVADVAADEEDITLTGGDPLQQPKALLPLVKELKRRLHSNIWCYTGYSWSQLVANSQLRPILDYLDVVVDGEFVQAKRDTGLRFRGSSNQRPIDVRRSLAAGTPVEWTD